MKDMFLVISLPYALFSNLDWLFFRGKHLFDLWIAVGKLI